MKRAIAGLLLLLVMSVALPSAAAAEVPPRAVEGQLEALDLREMETLLQSLDEEIGDYLPQQSLEEFLYGFLSGEMPLNARDFLQGLLGLIRQELLLNIHVLGQLIFLSVACAVLNNLQAAFAQDTVGKMARLIMVFIMALLILNSVNLVMETGEQAVSRMASFMQVLFPIQLVLLVALGSVTTAGLLQPSLFLMLNLINLLVTRVLFPVIYFEVVLKVVNNLSDTYKIDQLAGLCRRFVLMAIGGVSTVFLTVLSLQGIGGAAIDGMGLRTAKYVAGAFVPVVGGMLADIMETIAGGSLLIKNAFGLLGLLVIFLLTVIPTAKILIISLMYKGAAALTQPLGDSKVSALLSDMADSLLLVFAAVMMVSVMFFLSIVIMTTMANFAVMLR